MGFRAQVSWGELRPMAPREVDGCNKLWKRAGAEVSNFGMWALGPQPAERGVFGHNKGVPCGAREIRNQPGTADGPHGSQSPLGISLAIPVAGSGLTLFFSGVPTPKTD